MATYLVVHPKLALKAAINGGKEKLQNLPVGCEVEIDEVAARRLVKEGKLRLVNAVKAKASSKKSSK